MNITLPITFDRDTLLAALGITATQPPAVTPPVPLPPAGPFPPPPPPVTAPPAIVLPPDLNGLRTFSSNIPWSIPGQINRHTSDVIDPSSAWLAHFVPTANSVRPGRIQVVDAFSQDTFRVYVLFRDSDGFVVARMSGITATFNYWVGPGNPDPTSTWIFQLEAGTPYTLAVFNNTGVTISGQVGLDIYQ